MAINVSNPTSATGRKTVGAVLEGMAQYLRQDLAYLKALAGAPGARTPLSALEEPPSGMVESFKAQINEVIGRLPVETTNEHEWPLPKHPDGAVPLCTLRNNGVLLRPTRMKAKGNAVATSRMFGGALVPGDEIRALLASLPQDIVHQAVQSKIFTRGTVEGFEKRLALLTGKTVKSIFKSPGFPSAPAERMRLLERLLPVDTSLLPDWHGGEEADLMGMLREAVKITPAASAGAPYWRAKGEVMTDIFYVIEHCIDKLKDGKLDELLKEQPELFVIECKNKEDRYDIEKLSDKTRPYFCPPAHWSLLASYLHQAISHALYKVGGSTPTWNAYGWSAAHGGITRLVREVHRRFNEGERGWGYVYGDDGDLYFRVNRLLYRVSPDVKQMDSCVDYDTIRLTYAYILHCFQRQWGASSFWVTIVKALLEIFEKPRILISGTQLYTKPADGLLSGIVGTTLFDTVKSAVAYNSLLESHASDPSKLLNAPYVTRWMLEHHGLVIKEGTWAPEALDLNVQPCQMTEVGDLIDPHLSLYGSGKFLGVQYVHVQGPVKTEWVPYLPDVDWATAILSPRDSSLGSGLSTTARQRLAFDRIRGYLTTGAALSRSLRLALYHWLDRLPGEVVLMQPQGTTPPEGVLFGEEQDTWEYPAPEFLPDPHWVFDLYAEEGNHWDKPRTAIFSEEVMSKVNVVRQQVRKVRIEMKGDKTEIVPFVPQEVVLPQVLPEMVEVKQNVLESHWKGDSPPQRALHPEMRVALPEVGVPFDLSVKGQTAAQARVNAELNVGKDSILHQVVDPGNVRPLKQVSRIVEGETIRIPRTMISEETGTRLVHPPTVGGFLPPVVGGSVSAVLLKNSFPTWEFVMVKNASLPVHAAAEWILQKRRIYIIWGLPENYSRLVGEGADRVSVAESRVVLYWATMTTDNLPAHDLKEGQVWQGRSLKDIKLAFSTWVISQNKQGSQEAATKEAAKDWSMPADRSKVPYSFVDGPLPKPEFLNPANPLDIRFEDRSGRVRVAGAVAPPLIAPLPAPVPAESLPIPTQAENSLPFVEVPEGSLLPIRKPKSPLWFKPPKRRWWDYSSDEDVEQGFENAYFDRRKGIYRLRPEFREPPIPPRNLKPKKNQAIVPMEVVLEPYVPPSPPVDEVEAPAPKPAPRRSLAVVAQIMTHTAGPEPVASSSGVSSVESTSSGEESREREPLQPLPPKPEGGWPYYLVVPSRSVRQSDWPARSAFTRKYGRLPKIPKDEYLALLKEYPAKPRKPRSQAGEASTTDSPKNVTPGGVLPSVKVGGPKSFNFDFSSLSTEALEAILRERKDAKKAKAPQSSSGSGGEASQGAIPKTAPPPKKQAPRRPSVHPVSGEGSQRPHDTGAGDRRPRRPARV